MTSHLFDRVGGQFSQQGSIPEVATQYFLHKSICPGGAENRHNPSPAFLFSLRNKKGIGAMAWRRGGYEEEKRFGWDPDEEEV